MIAVKLGLWIGTCKQGCPLPVFVVKEDLMVAETLAGKGAQSASQTASELVGKRRHAGAGCTP